MKKLVDKIVLKRQSQSGAPETRSQRPRNPVTHIVRRLVPSDADSGEEQSKYRVPGWRVTAGATEERDAIVCVGRVRAVAVR